MTPSPRIKSFIKGYEKLRLAAYLPTPNDVPTIGYGHTVGVKLGDTCTPEQADAWFASDMDVFSKGVATAIFGAPTTGGQFDAMVSLAYNIGLAGFLKSSVRTNHVAQHYQTAAMAFALWNKQRDKKTGQLVVVNGLTKRRAAEAAIYRGEST